MLSVSFGPQALDDTGQRLNGHVLPVNTWHRRCRPDSSIHLAPRLKKGQGVTFRSWPRQPRSV
jgi:hypothetical protein